MAIVVRRNPTLSSLVNDFFDTAIAVPSIFDLDNGLLDLDRTMVPDANIIENDKDYKIELAAPGLERKDFKVETDHHTLTISAEKREEKKEEDHNYRRREFSYNAFSRSFNLPENSMPDKVDAKYENGILRLTLPKKEVRANRPKKEIKVS